MTAILSESDNFPDVSLALKEPNGLLAIGCDLSVTRLRNAYQHGIFPWYCDGQPILWWSPDPRGVLFLDEFKITRSLKKILRQQFFKITIDQDFRSVVRACALPRAKQPETWITDEMLDAYCQLHQVGDAHSIEVWRDQQLIGGLYGVDCGGIFTGESMFAFEANAAKIALVGLVTHLKNFDYELIDCQFNNAFLQQFGTRDIPREQFISILRKSLKTSNATAWQMLASKNIVVQV